VPPLDGCVLAISGKFDSTKHTHASLEQLVKSLGGSVTKSVTKTTTHVVCTEDDYNNGSAKVAAGKAKELPLVSPEWIFESEKQNKTIDPQDHVWDSAQPSDSQANGKKRPIMVSKSDEDEEPETKKAKTAGSKASKAAGTKAKAAKSEPEPETDAKVEEESQVAEGQFIKKKNVAIPVDERCPFLYHEVYVDPDSGLIYDASLNQTNSSANNNKFYRLQVSCAYVSHC
jgi:poly [ADP-ribose] polymerase